MKGDPKLLFIYNPYSGQSQIEDELADIVEIFSDAGYQVTVCPTKRKGYAVDAVRCREDNYDLLVCCGGDGTMDEVVSGMMISDRKIPIGYIPAGTTNDFAASLKIPTEMKEAARIAVDGEKFSCDIGKMNDSYFVYAAAFGLFTEVSYETDQDAKYLLGHIAYILEGIRSIGDAKSYHMRVKYKDRIIEDDFILGMVTNSVSVGGFREITGKNVKLNDGVFEVTLIRQPNNPVELTNIVASLLNKDIESDMLYRFDTDSLEFESSEEVKWTRDGEFGGAHSHVKIQNLHEAVDIIVPE